MAGISKATHRINWSISTFSFFQPGGITDVMVVVSHRWRLQKNAETEGAAEPCGWCELDQSNMVQLGYEEDSMCLGDSDQEPVWVVKRSYCNGCHPPTRLPRCVPVTAHERKDPSTWAFNFRRRVSASVFPSALHIPGPQPSSHVSGLAQRLLDFIETGGLA